MRFTPAGASNSCCAKWIGITDELADAERLHLDEAKSTSSVFLDKMLRPNQDQAFLIQFGYEVELLGGLTSSRERLTRALDLLEAHKLESPGRTGGGGAGQSGGFNSLNTVLADSIYLASDRIMKTQQGRKALIVLGDGFHIGDRGEMAVAAAQQADTLIYTIRIFDQAFSGGGMGSFGFPGGWFLDSRSAGWT